MRFVQFTAQQLGTQKNPWRQTCRDWCVLSFRPKEFCYWCCNYLEKKTHFCRYTKLEFSRKSTIMSQGLDEEFSCTKRWAGSRAVWVRHKGKDEVKLLEIFLRRGRKTREELELEQFSHFLFMKCFKNRLVWYLLEKGANIRIWMSTTPFASRLSVLDSKGTSRLKPRLTAFTVGKVCGMNSFMSEIITSVMHSAQWDDENIILKDMKWLCKKFYWPNHMIP